MRRQARISIGGALVVRSASALQVWLWLLIFVFQNEFRISRSIQPGYLDFDNLPETNFTCAGKVIGGYYADLETSCQMFHVCTVGQQDEPMDIKFLCLNGTVFDQETRVCERVDEVDCTKSEKFYSLNLELYGSTAPPIIQPEISSKPQTNPTEQSYTITTKTSTEDLSDPFVNESPTSSNDKTQDLSADTLDSTDDPIQDVKKEEKVSKSPSTQTAPVKNVESMNDEYRVEDDIDDEYEEFYSHPATTSSSQSITTTSTTTQPPVARTSTTTSTTRRPPSTSSTISSQAPVTHSSSTPSNPPLTTIDPSLLSPQEFIYRHRGPGSEAISFQRQSFRPADGVFITHAPPQQFDHFQYESSRTAPRPVSRPTPFVPRPQPFRATTHDPRDQLLRPGPSSQPSERHETSVKHRSQPYPSVLPSQQSLPFNFYYDRKRSDDLSSEKESPPSARSVAPPTISERPYNKPKSPPRVIVTASASVSDSNGKKLNYTVGNVVSAVKPIVAINYDDYKESDLIFDPFFLDVPKLNKRRKTRSSKHRKIFTVPATATIPTNLVSKSSIESTLPPATSRATTIKITFTTPSTTTTTAAWNPEDYVDDNYEPHAYLPPIPPLAVFVSQERVKHTKVDKESKTNVSKDKLNPIELSTKNVGRKDDSRPTPSAVQMISSQSAGISAAAGDGSRDVTPSAPLPVQAPACASSRSTDCRNRA
ncbi:hypothetical protein RR46_10957 [Papilio xuthus]|uniref:Chitin-binding type-2 domain-containing protein n=1 Tax=Papilio xuthus TaxID=66420 RepID=A0A194PWU7_PAPXU|nr:hypothetical protein RR46_10957 [Papilio xuthus]